MGRVLSNDYGIRIPLKMIQMTDEDGQAWPLAFDWEENGDITRVKIDRVVSRMPFAEQRSGAVGDRYECIINGRLDYLYYGIIQPRKWFIVKSVSEDEYKAYYHIPGEN